MNNLLIGNGLSISISNDFSYSSLREKVTRESSPAVDRLFKKLNTVDFEHLLKKVKDARDVMEAITDGQIIVSQSISDEIRSKLIDAIQCMNPSGPFEHGFDPQQLNKTLKKYNSTFTTNYDIYLYWARKGDECFNIIDFFFDKGFFDRTNVDRRGRDAIYYLHGALFIFEEDNRVKKISKGSHLTLNEAIHERINNEKGYPLIITEGSPEEKLSNIKSNEYLSFCYDELRSISGDLDIYGHRLNPDIDGHIINAIKEANLDNIRFYQYKLNKMGIGERKHLNTTINSILEKEVELIDSSEHALCKWSIFEDI
jgi:hypothetical protein